MSALCQKRTLRGSNRLFHRAAEQRQRHGETEHSRGLHIDDQLEVGRLDNWQLRRLRALKDAANVATGLAIGAYEFIVQAQATL